MVHPLAVIVSFGVGLGVVLYALYSTSRLRVPEEPMGRQPPPEWRYEPTIEDQCTICLEELNADQSRLERLRCGHRFHFRCINKNREYTRECPNCRDNNASNIS